MRTPTTRYRRSTDPPFSPGVSYIPEDFARQLTRLKDASGLTWGEMARRLGTNTLTLRRWRAGTRPNALHLLALLDLAEELKLAHLLPKGTFHRR